MDFPYFFWQPIAFSGGSRDSMAQYPTRLRLDAIICLCCLSLQNQSAVYDLRRAFFSLLAGLATRQWHTVLLPAWKVRLATSQFD